MSPAVDSSVAMAALHSAPLAAPHPTNDPIAAKKAAIAFEGVFVTQFLGEMFSGISTDGPFGGGQGEEMFRSLMIDEYGKQIAAQGGFGLSDAVQRQLLKAQEIPH
jgi:flagellar protein FlgJ